jgi:hypothetical protein
MRQEKTTMRVGSKRSELLAECEVDVERLKPKVER